jgi:hypothetical protein
LFEFLGIFSINDLFFVFRSLFHGSGALPRNYTLF